MTRCRPTRRFSEFTKNALFRLATVATALNYTADNCFSFILVASTSSRLSRRHSTRWHVINLHGQYTDTYTSHRFRVNRYSRQTYTGRQVYYSIYRLSSVDDKRWPVSDWRIPVWSLVSRVFCQTRLLHIVTWRPVYPRRLIRRERTRTGSRFPLL